jgi:predicted Zn-ribbon and HTH transcriptional regulator
MPARMKKARFDSERNCGHCLFFRNILHSQDGSILSGTCLVDHDTDLIIYHGVTCEDFREDPKHPVPKRIWTEREIEAQKSLRRSRRLRGDKPTRSLKLYRKKEYPELKIKSPLLRSKKKQQRQTEILSDNKEASLLLNKLFSLPKRSSKEGRRIRRQLRKTGYYLSQKHEPLEIKKQIPPEVKKSTKKKIEILELTKQRKREFQRAGIIHIDTTLLKECAYYPRSRGASKPSKCTECSFSFPNEDCKFSHILIDTRIS